MKPPPAELAPLSQRGVRSLDDRPRVVEVAVWCSPVLAFFAFPDHLVLGAQVLIAGLFALSLDLILGYAGIVSLGHAAFFGVGAYVAALLSVHGHPEPLSGLLVAASAAACVGFCTSFLVVGGQGLTRLMVTLGIGLLLHEAANQASSITGGSDGLSGVVTGALFGRFGFDLFGRVAYVYTALVCASLVVLARRIVHSPFGLSLRGLRENERRMHALGAPVRRHLIQVYTLSAGIAGVAGALSAQTTEFVGLEVLSFERSASVLVMLVFGGVGRLYGGFLGSLAFMLLETSIASQSPTYWQFWLGAIVVAIAWVAEGGVLAQLGLLLARLRPGAAAKAARTGSSPAEGGRDP
jgi:branched-chain amino acid transport system permease protein